VLVVHENRGLTDHIRSVAGRFAASGYSALAIDLLSEEGGTGSFPDEAVAMAALYGVPTSRFVADMKAGVTELRRRVPGKKVAATGFCFGGGMVWTLLAANEPRLAAAAPFYGPFPEGSSLKGSKAAVLGIYAALDSRVNSSRPAAAAALRAAGLPHQLVTFPGVDHAFFNDTGGRYNRTQAEAAYKRVLAWFKRYVG
jgi:carboxymethylenebutenolidase